MDKKLFDRYHADWKKATTWVKLGVVVNHKGKPVRDYRTFIRWIKRKTVPSIIQEGEKDQYWVHRDEINELRLNAKVRPIEGEIPDRLLSQ